ncbi:MAG: glycogen synthase [Anaerolineae bacterium]|nr:glycogen synthase [Anaerolineae bacterium]
MRILIMTAEMTPFARTGEVAVVVGSLVQALHALGHDVRVAMPRYRHIDALRFDLEQRISPYPVPMDQRQDLATVYETQTASGVPVYLIDNVRYFGARTLSAYADDADAFIFYSRAVLELLKRPETDWHPDIIHCHDWQTGLVPNWLATVYRDDPIYKQTASVFTVHRLSHEGVFGYRVLQVAGIAEQGFLFHPAISDLGELVDLLGRGLFYADAITTVSESYACEIQTPESGQRLDPLLRDRSEQLFGILSGIDTTVYDPSSDPSIHKTYDPQSLDRRAENKEALQRMCGFEVRADVPLIGMISRLTASKGLDLLTAILDPLMANLDFQLVIMGVGDPEYHELLSEYVQRFPGRMALHLTFNDAIEHQIYAGSDLVLMPSLLEPCGLGQMAAMRYGSVPIVRAVGGLADTVEPYEPSLQQGTGFTFQAYDAMALYTAIVRALEAYRHVEHWRALQRRGMARDFSWAESAARYVEVYTWAQTHRRETQPTVSVLRNGE